MAVGEEGELGDAMAIGGAFSLGNNAHGEGKKPPKSGE